MPITGTPNTRGVTGLVTFPPVSSPHPCPMDSASSSSHSYGTRKANNITIRPAHRRRQSPDHTPTPAAHFPPPHVVLHPDDAGSKVFLAIGRAFLSVDNCAMTIKDLAEMVLDHGLVAQNVSAASQAITTYIRTHLHRCEVQQDIPLLLRHVLSGTDDDDDLLPALYSRTGGAQCSIQPEGRITNFRRGTMVWYLSRATGAPCPFARANIRLCDYGENGKISRSEEVVRERKTVRKQKEAEDSSCGQKRKRSLRSCALLAVHASDSDSENDHDKPPPKVKLTLRLKPLVKCNSSLPSSSSAKPTNSRSIIDLTRDIEYASDSDSNPDSSMSVDDTHTLQHMEIQDGKQLYPPSFSRHSPCNTLPVGTSPRFPTTLELPTESFRRSPSIANSVSSPPPESDDDDDDDDDDNDEADEEEEEAVDGDDDFQMSRARCTSTDFLEEEEGEEEEGSLGWGEEDEEDDSDEDGETLWESPGPRSPSAPPTLPPLPQLNVKDEPRDVQGMLDAWDDFDSSVADAKVVEVIAQAAAVLRPNAPKLEPRVKVEVLDSWEWDASFGQQQEWGLGLGLGEETIRIKQEDCDVGFESLFPSVGDDSLDLEDELSGQETSESATEQYGAKTVLFVQSQASTSFSSSPSIPTPTPQTMRTSITTDLDNMSPPPMSPGAAALVQLIQALSVHSPTTPTTPIPPSSSPQSSVASIPPPSSTQSSVRPSPPSVPPSSLVLSPALPTPRQTCVSPQAMRMSCTATLSKGEAEGVVVHTCQPCNPPISATQIEEISVYQMPLGPYLLLRRIDTDFVNLTPIVEWCGKSRGYPVLSMVPNAVVVGRGWGSEKVCGVWVPLEVAQAYVKDLDADSTGKDQVTEGLSVFLGDDVVERFPSALKDFHRTYASGRMLKQFGRWFESMVTCAQAQATGAPDASGTSGINYSTGNGCNIGSLNPQKVIQADSRPTWTPQSDVTSFPITGVFALGVVLAAGEREKLLAQAHSHHLNSLQRKNSIKEEGRDCLDVVSPLSAKEQELFRELCIIPGEEEEKDVQVKQEDIPKLFAMDVEPEGVPEVMERKLRTREVKDEPRPAARGKKRRSPSENGLDDVCETKRSTRASSLKAAAERQEQSLRRSKRVADAHRRKGA